MQMVHSYIYHNSAWKANALDDFFNIVIFDFQISTTVLCNVLLVFLVYYAAPSTHAIRRGTEFPVVDMLSWAVEDIKLATIGVIQ